MEEDLNKIEIHPPKTPMSSECETEIVSPENRSLSIADDDDIKSLESYLIVIESPPATFWKKFKFFLKRNKPACPPPVCYILIEQLIVFAVLATIGLTGFLVYWFYERE